MQLSPLLKPIINVKVVDRKLLKPNDYNPNKVLKQNLELLKESILLNGWTMPIVVRKDYTIIDGFHRWRVSGEEPLLSKLNGMVPVVIVEHDTVIKDMAGTITHNRARGVHMLEPMENIVKRMLEGGNSVEEIGKLLGMKNEEVYRLSGLNKGDFLAIMAGKEYTQEEAFIAPR